MGIGLHFPKKTLRDVPLDGETVLVRVDYNVPLSEQGEITDDFRIAASLPTIRYLKERGCRIVLAAHLGRPEGGRIEADSLEPAARRLSGLLDEPVAFVSDCIGDQAKQTVQQLQPGHVALLENLRFHAGEEANDAAFGEALAHDSSARYFVQDGFGVVHRAHASTDAVTRYLPSVAGLLLEKEWRNIKGAMESPERPLVAVLGGAKISDKIGMLEKFVAVADQIIIGGAMANTFLRKAGHLVGKSKVEDGVDSVIDGIYRAAAEKVGEQRVDDFLVLPSDVAVGRSTDAGERRISLGLDDVQADELILDIGSESIVRAAAIVAGARTVIWNGTLGYAELPQFAHGSARLALAMAANQQATTVVGGGDTADFVRHWDARGGGSFSHVSTGGGASLELMSGLPMPGIVALMDSAK